MYIYLYHTNYHDILIIAYHILIFYKHLLIYILVKTDSTYIFCIGRISIIFPYLIAVFKIII